MRRGTVPHFPQTTNSNINTENHNPHVSSCPTLSERVPLWPLEVPGHLEVLGRERGTMGGLEVVQMLLSLKKEGRTGGVQNTAVSSSHQTPPRPVKPPPTLYKLPLPVLSPSPTCVPWPFGHPLPSPPLSSPETRPAAAFRLHPCPPLQRRGAHTGSIHPDIHPLPGLFPTPSPAPGHPYPHSRGSQAHFLPGRSGGRTGTSPLPPPNGCKWRLLRGREERQSVPGLAMSPPKGLTASACTFLQL